MTTRKTIDRKTFLTSTAATFAAVTLGGCSDDGDPGGDGSIGTTTTGMGGTSAGGSSTAGLGGTSTTGVGGGGTSATSSAGTNAGGSSAGGSSAGGAGGTTTTASMGGQGGTSTMGSGAGGTSGAGAGGSAGNGGTTYMCTTDTDNGFHSHPLEIPPEDVAAGYPSGDYMLEDGGTGHIHTLTLTAYDFIYQQGGQEISRDSSNDDDHTHACVISCTSS
jgi:hypothetical protein